jgi:hypothetical protein
MRAFGPQLSGELDPQLETFETSAIKRIDKSRPIVPACQTQFLPIPKSLTQVHIRKNQPENSALRNIQVMSQL